MNAIQKAIEFIDSVRDKYPESYHICDELEALLKQEPVRGVVFRDGEPTLVQEKHVKQTDSSLYADPRPPCAPDEMVAIARERDRLVKIIRDFCDGQDWAAETWKAQAHIKPLFDAAKGAKL